MMSDGSPLPSLGETAILHRLGLVTSDEIPNLAARWLAADLVDTDSVRILAGENGRDPWTVEKLLADSLTESEIVPPTDAVSEERVAVDWVVSTWRMSHDTRWAIGTLARLGETSPAFDLGLFIGLDDEWNGCWGRLPGDLKADAVRELDRLAHGA